MKVNALNFALLSEIIKKEKLLNEDELNIIAELARNDFSFAPQLAIADSVHYHIHVPDIKKLSHELFINHNAVVENKKATGR